MAQFVLKICSGGKCVSVKDKDAIQPLSDADEIRIDFNRAASRLCQILVRNERSIKTYQGMAGTTSIVLGKVGQFTPGEITVSLSLGGFDSERQHYFLNNAASTSKAEMSSECADSLPLPEKETVGISEKDLDSGEKLAENRELQKKFEDLKREYKALEDRYNALKNSSGVLNDLSDEKNDWDARITSLKNDISEKRRTHEDLLSKYNQLLLDIEDCQASLNKKTAEKADLDKLMLDGKNIRSQKEDAQNKLDEINAELTRLQNAHTDASAALEELKQKRKDLGMKDDEIEQAEKDLKIKQEELDSWNDKIKDANEKIESQRNLLPGKEEEKEKLEKTLIDLEKETEKVRNDTAEADKALEKLQGEFLEKKEVLKVRLKEFYKELDLELNRETDIQESIRMLEISLDGRHTDDRLQKVKEIRELLDKIKMLMAEVREKKKIMFHEEEIRQGKF